MNEGLDLVAEHGAQQLKEFDGKKLKPIMKDNVQPAYRWTMQHGMVVLGSSTNPVHMRDDLGIFDFELTAQDMAELDAVGSEHWYASIGCVLLATPWKCCWHCKKIALAEITYHVGCTRSCLGSVSCCHLG